MNDKNPSNLFRTLQHKKLFYSLKMYEEERLTLRLSPPPLKKKLPF